jgi:hypothetical protein
MVVRVADWFSNSAAGEAGKGFSRWVVMWT